MDTLCSLNMHWLPNRCAKKKIQYALPGPLHFNNFADFLHFFCSALTCSTMIHCKGVGSGYQSRDRPDNSFYFEHLKKVINS
jgi:hypothetical protein